MMKPGNGTELTEGSERPERREGGGWGVAAWRSGHGCGLLEAVHDNNTPPYFRLEAGSTLGRKVCVELMGRVCYFSRLKPVPIPSLMDMKRVILLLLSAGLWLGGAFSVEAWGAKQPNILFILTDDQGWPSLGCYGSRAVPTPNLDRLAAEGIRFTDAYVMPQCTPTRAALLTGQHTARNGMWHVIPWYGTPWAPVKEPAYVEQLSRETFLLPKALKAAGYATGQIGKWHLNTNEDGNYVALKPEAAAHHGFDWVAPAPVANANNKGDKEVDRYTADALGFIREHKEQPWFLYLAHHTLHHVLSAPEALVQKHRARGAPEKGNFNALYLACIEHLDNSIGKLMAGLEELGQKENTIVVFLSDNGGIDASFNVRPVTQGDGRVTKLEADRWEFDNAPLRAGKGSAYEGGIRVPCLVRWPKGIKGNRVENTPVHVTDWLPTLCALAGAKVPAEHKVDGADLSPLLRGQKLKPRPLYWYMPLYDLRWGGTPCAVVREGDFKLIEFFGDWVDPQGNYLPGNRVQLFNLREDIGETRNLALALPDKTKALREQLHAWMKSVPAEIPGPNEHHDPSKPLKETREKPDFVKTR